MRAAAAALPSSDRGGGSGIDGATAAGRAVGRAVEPLLAALRWLQSRLLAVLGWLRLGLRLGRRAPVMGVVLPVGRMHPSPNPNPNPNPSRNLNPNPNPGPNPNPKP